MRKHPNCSFRHELWFSGWGSECGHCESLFERDERQRKAIEAALPEIRRALGRLGVKAKV